MHARVPAAAAGALLALALAACSRPEPSAPRAGESVVLLVVLDALHAEHLSHLGYERPTTPNLDRLAADGVSFSRAFSTAPYTRAGIPSIHTGRLPDHHGMTDGDAMLAAQEVTLAELFAEAGRPTRAAVANLNGSELYGMDQGFQEFHNLMLPIDGRSADVEAHGVWYHEPKAEEFVPLVERWLEEDGGAPAFYYLHVLEPHSPYHPPDEYRERWLDPAYDGPFLAGDNAELIAAKQGKLEVTERDREAVRALYDATLAYADAQFGRILDELERRGLYDEALIVVTSDHGEAMWQHGVWGHNDQLYDEMVHVPLIVKLPRDRSPEHAIDATLVSTLDVLPSLVEWCGLVPPTVDLHGASLEDLLFRTEVEFDRDRELILRTNEKEPDLALRTPRDKTIVVRFPKGRIQRVEHYDLVRDPDELENLTRLAGDLPSARAKLLVEYRDRARERLAGRPTAEVSDAQRALLEQLGYAQESEDDGSDGDGR